MANLIKGFVFAVLAVPFLVNKNIYFPFVGFKSLYFMAVSEAAFFLWIFLVLRWKKYCFNVKKPVVISIIAFLAVSFVAALAGSNFLTSFWSDFERMSGVLMFLHLGAIFAVVLSVFGERDWRWFFSASITVASIIGIEALFNQDPVAHAGGFIGNDSFLGSYIIFNVFIALYLAVSKKWQNSRWLKFLSIAAFVVLSLCLLFEGTQFWASVIGKNPQMPEGGLIKDVIDSGARAAKISFAAGLVLL
ncbi:MAG: hypothetical protein WCX69_05645, partial [Candidatus Paceibacterota bacterium]